MGERSDGNVLSSIPKPNLVRSYGRATGACSFDTKPVVSLTILNLCLISAIMALGVNIQWGYAGLFNVGVMGFAA